MNELALPDGAAGVDATWLTEALRAGGGVASASVTDVRAERVAEAVGLMGEITRFHLTWDRGEGDLPASVIAKLPSALEDNRALALAMGYYECEHRFYTELAVDAGLATPGCWFSGADAESGRYALLLEDLGHLERIDQLDGCPGRRAEGVVDALADLHAAWWDDPRLTEAGWLPDGLGDDVRVYGQMVAGSWPSFADATAELITDADRAVAERFIERYDHMVDLSLEDPHTLCHRDFRLDNMHFRADGTPVVFDWGGVAHGGGLYDVAYFLAGSLDIDERRACGDALLARYLERLRESGVELPEGDLERWTKVGALFCLVVPILAGGDVLDTRDEKGERLVAEGIRRLFAYLHDVDAVSILD